MISTDDNEIPLEIPKLDTPVNVPFDPQRWRENRDLILGPALRRWLEVQCIAYETKEYDFRGMASQCDCGEWFFVEFESLKPNKGRTIIGVSGAGEVGV